MTRISPWMQRNINSLQWRKPRSQLAEFEYNIELDDKNVRKLTISQIPNCEMRGLGTGAMVWDAAICLCKWLELIKKDYNGLFQYVTSQTIVQSPVKSESLNITPDDFPLPLETFEFKFQLAHDQKWIELGAGQGFVGICCASLGVGEVVCTDLPILKELIEFNVTQNCSDLKTCDESNQEQSRVSFFEFDWSSVNLPQELNSHFDLVIVCECLYANVPHHLLLNALLLITRGFGIKDGDLPFTHTKDENPPFILLVYEHRNQVVFFEFMKSAMTFFDICKLPPEILHKFYQTNDIFFFAMKLKKQMQ
ncbi:MAG: hypothetical protein EZS28_000515 [Streblomastix strix]|uniref:Uncharacterized protein n=1 Tax=Streblomastix strix TaxID=222440 RepID=A0A5J4XBT1_9EUKA|nr:MAG: hypothetical protein EZS28_000515 [Streblomastix strix]